MLQRGRVVALLCVGAFVAGDGPLVAHDGEHSNRDAPVVIPVARLKYKNEVVFTRDAEILHIRSNGIPNHDIGTFPNRENPNSVSPQEQEYSVPIHPRELPDYTIAPRIAGVAVNGVLFEPGTAETWRGNREWREEAIVNGRGRLGLDRNHGHVQPTGKYHYHGVPTGLIEVLSGTASSKAGPVLVGWAADGFPIYFDESVSSSWKVRKGSRPSGGPGGHYDGLYTADYEYVEGSGDLDRANGKRVTTREFTEGTYAYFVTETFPYLPRYLKGLADQSFVDGPPGPGGRPGGPGGRSRERQGPSDGGPPPFPPGDRPPPGT